MLNKSKSSLVHSVVPTTSSTVLHSCRFIPFRTNMYVANYKITSVSSENIDLNRFQKSAYDSAMTDSLDIQHAADADKILYFNNNAKESSFNNNNKVRKKQRTLATFKALHVLDAPGSKCSRKTEIAAQNGVFSPVQY